MHKTSISLVSYWNTRPFLFGLQKSGLTEFFEVFLDTPSAGGKRLMNNEVDIALAPVITLNSMADARLLTHYCIGAAGSVRTVCLFSHEPPETLRKVYLDAHSLTSVRLIRIIYSLNNWSEPNGYRQMYTLECCNRVKEHWSLAIKVFPGTDSTLMYWILQKSDSANRY